MNLCIAAKYWSQIRADQENNKDKVPKQPQPKKKEAKQEKKQEKQGKEIEEEKVPYDSNTTDAPSNKSNIYDD